MTTRLDLMTRIRIELGDVPPAQVAPIWSDALLQEYLREAIREWSLVRAVQRHLTMAGVVGQTDFLLAAEIIPNGVMTVEWPGGVVVPAGTVQNRTPRWSWDIGANGSTIWFYDQCYEMVEDGHSQYLRFRYPLPPEAVGQSIVVTFLGYYGVPGQDSDVLEVAVEDETALLWFVCGRAYRWLDEQRAKRGVFAGSGANNGTGKSGAAASDYEQRYWASAESRRRSRGLRNATLAVER